MPSGNFLLCSALDSTIRIWDVEKGICPITLNSPTFFNERYCLTPCFYLVDGNPLVISGSENGILHIWNIKESPGSCIIKKKISSNRCNNNGEIFIDHDNNKDNSIGQDDSDESYSCERPILALDVCPTRPLIAVSILDDKNPNFRIYSLTSN